MLGPSGSGKTTTLRMIAGFERPDEGRIMLRRQGRDRRTAVRARREHGLPGLRALPAHDRARERRVRPAREGREEARPAPAGRRGARARAARWLRRSQAGTALRRPAAARGARARDRQPPAVLLLDEPLGALDLKLRQGDAGRAEADPAGGRDHVRLRDARPGRGADDERPHRRLQPGKIDQIGTRPRSTSGRRTSSSPRSSGSRTCSSATAAVHDPPGADHDRASGDGERDDPRALYAGPVTRTSSTSTGRRGHGRRQNAGPPAPSEAAVTVAWRPEDTFAIEGRRKEQG